MGDLESVNAFPFLLAVVLSAPATDESVNKATRTLFALAPTPEAIVELGVERVQETIGSLDPKVQKMILQDNAAELYHIDV